MTKLVQVERDFVNEETPEKFRARIVSDYLDNGFIIVGIIQEGDEYILQK